MALDAGAVVTADELRRLQPTTYQAIATADLAGSVTTTDVTGATVTLTTETDDAVFVATGVFDFDLTGAVTTTGQGFLAVDGTRETAEALLGAEVSTDRGTTTQMWRGTLGTAGSHTLKLQGTLPANMEINATHTTLTITIYEVI
jgi:hypothetical protein